MTTREFLKQQIDQFNDEEIQYLAQFIEFLHHRNQQIAPDKLDPLIGLFAGSPELATQAEAILQHNNQPHSGWSWKPLSPILDS
jgi:hypothetical protein